MLVYSVKYGSRLIFSYMIIKFTWNHLLRRSFFSLLLSHRPFIISQLVYLCESVSGWNTVLIVCLSPGFQHFSLWFLFSSILTWTAPHHSQVDSCHISSNSSNSFQQEHECVWSRRPQSYHHALTLKTEPFICDREGKKNH